MPAATRPRLTGARRRELREVALRDGDGLFARALHRLVRAAPTTRSWSMAGSARNAACISAKSREVRATGCSVDLEGAAQAGRWGGVRCGQSGGEGGRRPGLRSHESEPPGAAHGRRSAPRNRSLSFGRGDIDFRRFSRATSFGRPATRSWSGACARPSQATRRGSSGRSTGSARAGGPAADA